MSAELTIALGFVLIVFAIGLNVVVVQYGRGAARAAVEEGVSAGATQGSSVAECQAAAIEMFDSLLPGSYGDDIGLTCFERDGVIVARATGAFGSWFGPMPDVNVDIEAVATKELP